VKIRVHKITSVVHRLNIDREVEVSEIRRPARDGDVVAVRAKAEKRIYGEVELVHGRMAKIFRGDVLVGALGRRRALKGFVGDCPPKVGPGDELAVLNLGGVIGVPRTPFHPDLGSPCLVEVLGFVLNEKGETATVRNAAIPDPAPGPLPALILVSGTSMAAGKTRAACEIIHELSSAGLRVDGAKLTGVACRRDLLVMNDHGALRTASFLDCGLVSTVGIADLAAQARKILRNLEETNHPDVVVAELGDGILGDYGVMNVLRDLRDHLQVHVVCATDPAGAWGAREYLGREGVKIDIMSGPCTDSIVGINFVEKKLELAAFNACSSPHELGEAVLRILDGANRRQTE